MIQAQAPDFCAQALLPAPAGGEPAPSTVTLSALRGQWVLLFFYPLNFTFVCPTEITAFADRHAEFAAMNCQLLACSCDSVYTHLAWCNTRRADGGLGFIRIPMIADFDKSIATAYDVLLEDGSSLRGSFLIDPTGVVRQVTINDLPVGRNVDEAIRLLKAFQFADEHGEVCPANWQPGSATMKPEPVEAKAFFQARAEASPPSPDGFTRVKFGTMLHPHSPPLTAFQALLAWYTTKLREAPIITKGVTSAVIGMAGEIIGSQLRAHSTRQSVDRWQQLRRLAVFGSYGLLCTGPFFHWWYAFLEKFVASLHLPHGDVAILVKLFIQQFVLTPPFLAFTLAYINFFLTFDASKTAREVKNAFAAALFTNWKVWTVAQAFNFKVVPLDLRVLFGNVVALWWNIYLSMLNSARG